MPSFHTGNPYPAETSCPLEERGTVALPYDERVRFRISILRHVKRLTLKEAVANTNMHYTTWGRIESGDSRSIALSDVETISNVLGVSPEELLGPLPTFLECMHRLVASAFSCTAR